MDARTTKMNALDACKKKRKVVFGEPLLINKRQMKYDHRIAN